MPMSSIQQCLQMYPKFRWWSHKNAFKKRIRVMNPRAYFATKDDYEGLGKYKYKLMRLALVHFQKKGCRIL